MNIGKIISKKRAELGLTLEQVGNAVGVSKSTVKKWEDGYIANMRRDKLADLARVLKLNPVVFVTDDIEPPSPSPEAPPSDGNADSPTLKQAYDLMTSLDEESQQKALDYLLYLESKSSKTQ